MVVCDTIQLFESNSVVKVGGGLKMKVLQLAKNGIDVQGPLCDYEVM